MFVVKQVPPVCIFILLIFVCVVLRKVQMHSLFTLETVDFPKCLLFLYPATRKVAGFYVIPSEL